MNIVRSARMAAIGAAFMSAATFALAELPAAVGTSVTEGKTDGVALVAMLATAGAAVFIIAKVLRRFGLFL